MFWKLFSIFTWHQITLEKKTAIPKEKFHLTDFLFRQISYERFNDAMVIGRNAR